MIDIVFPDNNEPAFIEMAEKLGYSELCFVYSKKQTLKEKTKLKIYSGLLCKNKVMKSDLTLIESNNRNILKKKPNIIFNIEGTRDFIHQRDSGLDHVICKDMHKYNVAYAIPFSSILNSDDRERLIGRIMQNLKLCRKYKVPVVVASFAKSPFDMRNSKDLLSFCQTLGMHASEAKNALERTEEIIKENLHPKKAVEKLD